MLTLKKVKIKKFGQFGVGDHHKPKTDAKSAITLKSHSTRTFDWEEAFKLLACQFQHAE